MKNAITQRKVFERYLTDDEVRRLLGAIDKSAGYLSARDAGWVRLILATGIRIGTLAQLTVEDAQQALASKRLCIRPEISKGGRGYDILLVDKAADALKSLLRVRKQFEPQADTLLLARTGEAMSVRTLQKRFREWVLAAGITRPASPHWLRHTLAKRIRKRSEADNPLEHVQLVLGHARLHTSQIYAMPDIEDIRKSMEAATK